MRKYWTLLAGFALAMFALCFNRMVGKGITIQYMIVLFVLAPILEEFFFRYLPIKFGRKHNLVTELMWISTYLFAIGHTGQYPYFGWHYAILIQGTFGLLAWYTCKCMGYRGAVLLHLCYNLFLVAV